MIYKLSVLSWPPRTVRAAHGLQIRLFIGDTILYYLRDKPESVKLENSFSKRVPDAWKNSQKSAVVGGGEGESSVNEHGDWRHVDDAGLKLEHGVLTS